MDDHLTMVLLPEFMKIFNQFGRNIGIHVTQASLNMPRTELISGQLDFAFRYRLEDTVGMETEPLASETFLTLGRYGHPALQNARISLDDFIRYKLAPILITASLLFIANVPEAKKPNIKGSWISDKCENFENGDGNKTYFIKKI